MKLFLRTNLWFLNWPYLHPYRNNELSRNGISRTGLDPRLAKTVLIIAMKEMKLIGSLSAEPNSDDSTKNKQSRVTKCLQQSIIQINQLFTIKQVLCLYHISLSNEKMYLHISCYMGVRYYKQWFSSNLKNSSYFLIIQL